MQRMLNERGYTAVSPPSTDADYGVWTHPGLHVHTHEFDGKLSVKCLRRAIDLMEAAETNTPQRVIIIKCEQQTAPTRALADACPYRIEVFTHAELSFCPLEHVSKHEPLSAPEVAALTDRLRTPVASLPRILESDVISKYLGLRCGTVVRITRPSGTCTHETCFRVVVK